MLAVNVDIKVREVMTRNVITISPEKSALDAAKIMKKNNIGSVVVIENSKPIGIVTERDLCFRVVAENNVPSKVKVKDIMTSPLITIDPNETLEEAARKMNKNKIRRLPVVDKNNNLVGFITYRDILTIAPEVIEILKEYNKINESEKEISKEVPERGTCEICGDHGVELYEVNGVYVCESCKEDLTLGKEE